MYTSSLIKSYSLFMLSLIVMGLGISLVTLAYLGTTPITSPPFTASFSVPISFGMLTMLMNFIFVLIQIILLGKEFKREQYLQLLVGPVLGVAIDGWSLIISLYLTENYLVKLGMVILGCIIIALSTIIQLKANVVNNPAEGIVKAIAYKTNKEFGDIKLYFDITLVIIALIISYVTLGEIQGVREGTIISAIIIGPMIRKFQQVFL
ncbi:YczE/YyaS/YitT family protein [Pseudogracilibacillus sp. ICA-222130]|uniref:YczE/YyaS/YitT family protein n=1 Tax=Pseudogracilibacillus sp. ICA-222130 TaxID=3134655 RepID=UPI0030BB4305